MILLFSWLKFSADKQMIEIFQWLLNLCLCRSAVTLLVIIFRFSCNLCRMLVISFDVVLVEHLFYIIFVQIVDISELGLELLFVLIETDQILTDERLDVDLHVMSHDWGVVVARERRDVACYFFLFLLWLWFSLVFDRLTDYLLTGFLARFTLSCPLADGLLPFL